MSSGYYYYDLGLMERFATLLGRREEAAAFAARRKSVAAAINRVFRDEETGDYAGGQSGLQRLRPVSGARTRAGYGSGGGSGG